MMRLTWMRASASPFLKTALLAAVLSASGLAVATAKPLYNTPVLDPETGSFFELVDLATAYPGTYTNNVTDWDRMYKAAIQREYEGRRGRLAIVNSRHINDFLQNTFHPEEPAFIGLRYWCVYHTLQWVNGDILRPKDYQNWGPVWNVDVSVREGKRVTYCKAGDEDYWPVHYWGEHDVYGFTWNANGNRKWFPTFFVEYPAPKKGADKGGGAKPASDTAKPAAEAAKDGAETSAEKPAK